MLTVVKGAWKTGNLEHLGDLDILCCIVCCVNVKVGRKRKKKSCLKVGDRQYLIGGLTKPR